MRSRLLAAGIELCEVPAGRYVVGTGAATKLLAKPPDLTWDGYPLATPVQMIDVANPFWISQSLITTSQYARFTNQPAPNPHAVIRAGIAEAKRFANELGGDVPRWYEWEIAVRGPEPFLYPWGNEFDLSR